VRHISCASKRAVFFPVSGDEDHLLCAFAAASKAAAPSTIPVVVIENLDVVCRKRSFKSMFLSCTDNPAFNSVGILATSNAPWDIDTCVLRHFERRIMVPLPDLELRAEVLHRHFAGCTVADRLSFNDYLHVSRSLEGYPTSDVITVAKNAGLRALKQGESLTRSDLVHCAQIVRPTFCREMIPLFASFAERFGTKLHAIKDVYDHQHDAPYLSMYS